MNEHHGLRWAYAISVDSYLKNGIGVKKAEQKYVYLEHRKKKKKKNEVKSHSDGYDIEAMKWTWKMNFDGTSSVCV